MHNPGIGARWGAAALLLGLGGCGAPSKDFRGDLALGYSYVEFGSAGYAPKAAPGLGAYEGKSLLRGSGANEAEDTDRYGFRSAYADVYYGNDVDLLSDVFYNALLRQLEAAAARIVEDDPASPAIDLALKDVTDKRFVVEAKVRRGERLAVDKTFTLNAPPPTDAELRSEAAMSERIYGMLGKTVVAILLDPDVMSVAANVKQRAPETRPAAQEEAKP